MDQEKNADVMVTVQPIHIRTMSGDSSTSKKFRDEGHETLSQMSSATSLRDIEAGKSTPKWYRRSGSGPVRRWFGAARTSNANKRQMWCRWVLIVFVILGFFAVIAAIIYISFVGALITRLAPPSGHSGLDHIVSIWKEPDTSGAFKYGWKDDFSRDIVTKNCHSHNDYWRHVPLYAALAAGCTSIEADVWLTEDDVLLVSHSWSSTRAVRTLHTLYLDPLANILEQRNVSTASTSNKETGVFDTDPNTSTILLIDFKSDGHKIWPVLQTQLQKFRDNDWLTYYDGTTLYQGPLTIVGSGNTPFELVQQNSTNRFIFYDAPLQSVSQPQYNTTNSYYASANLKAAMGGLWLGTFSWKQENNVKQQIQAAAQKGLKSRYWDTPAWPIGMRDRVWAKLMEFGVGVLNVDDLVSATRWNWGFCVVAGIALCGKT